jgi:hypothetical protein
MHKVAKWFLRRHFDPETLAELHKRPFAIGAQPYYAFQCRPVRRDKRRYHVPIIRGIEIVEQTKRMVDGISKRFRYVMSHKSGKVEILGVNGDKVHMKCHQARDPVKLGRSLVRKRDPGAGWLDELPRLWAASRDTGGGMYERRYCDRKETPGKHAEESGESTKKVRLPSPEVIPHSCEPRGELFIAHECDRFRASGIHHKGEMPDLL